MSNHQYGVKLPLVFIAVLGLLGAFLAGRWVATEDFMKVGAIGGLMLIAATLGFVKRQLLFICFIIVVFDFYAAPLGFKTTPTEQTFFLVFLIWLSVIWREEFRNVSPAPFEEISSYRFYRIIVLIASIYALIHFLFNFRFPYEPLAFGWQGASKTYIQVFGLFLITILIFDSRIISLISKSNSLNLLRIFTICYFILLIIKFYSILKFGGQGNRPSTIEEQVNAVKTFIIPIINVWDNFFTLRNLGPIAALVGATFYFNSRYRSTKFYGLSLILGGIVGSIFAGGRASLFFCFGLLILGMLHAKRGILILFGCGFLAMLIGIVLILPANDVEALPWHVQRSLALMRPDVKTDATVGAQQGLNDIRVYWFKNALDYWFHGDMRLILTGRSVSSMQDADVQSFVLSNEKETVFFGIRRLATHNGITDMLIGFGIIGYLLIILISIGCIIALNSYQKKFESGSYGDCWLFIAKIAFGFWLFYTHLGGNFVWAISIWLVIIAMLQTDGLKTDITGTEVDKSIEYTPN